MSGPSFAKEMMEKHPIALTLASGNNEWNKFVQTALNSLSAANIPTMKTTD